MTQDTSSTKKTNTPSEVDAKHYLATLLKPYASTMRLALLMAISGECVFIIQSYLLAQLFADWLTTLSAGDVPTSTRVWYILPVLAVCLIVRPILNLIRAQHLLKTSLNIRQNVRKKLLSAIVKLGPARQHYGSDGELSTKVLEQVDELDGYISHFYVQRYLAVITPLIIAVVTFFYSPLASGLMLLTAPLVPVFMILVGSAASEKSQAQFVAMSRLSGRFLDLLRGMATLKRLNATVQALGAVRRASVDYQKRTMSVLRLAFLSGAVLELFASLAIALVALYLGLGLLGILPWAKGYTPVEYAGALFILLLAPEFYAPLRQLGSDYHAKAKAEAAVGAFYPLLQSQDNTPINNSANGSDADSASLALSPTLTARQLSITAHDGRTRLVATDFDVKAGECLALVGESGAGKSSLLQAVLGFVPFSGHLQINHIDCTQTMLADVRQHMGYLAQSASLLPMSIAENLRLAKSHASDAELKDVLKQVELWPLIKRLPEGVDTRLGERGQGLSGGQQQRLAIAQLLLRDARLWLLDEPCAHLDEDTAQQIFNLLGELKGDKTVLLVSHDLSCVHWVDKTVKLDMPKTDASQNPSHPNGVEDTEGSEGAS